MADRLRVTELDFDQIKNNLKLFLKQQSEFQDYDFDGSGLSVLLDILAYNTHYNAYYLNMVANEAFLDTALLRDSVVSHAKTLGYTPFSRRSPVARIDVKIPSSNTATSTLTIPKGFAFLSNQIDSKPYKFIVLKEQIATKANSEFIFRNLDIYEGQLINYNFVHDVSTNPKQIFLLPDDNIDTTTIKVSVSPAVGNTQLTVFNKATDILDVTTNPNVYFLQEHRSGRFQIYFGDGNLGTKLPHGGVVYVSYISTGGTQANKANNFIATARLTDSLGEQYANFTITSISAASGGSDREPIDSIKFNSTAQYLTQNRLVTLKDYESYIKKQYPAIDSLSIWGGEDAVPKVYGKVFISLKPKAGYYLSETEKQRIIDDIINPKSIVTITAEILEPDYLYAYLLIKVSYDPLKTSLTEEQLKNSIRNSILLYKTTYLDKFDSRLIDSKLENSVDNSDNSIIGNEIEIKLQKRFIPILNKKSSYIIDFGVPLKRGSVIDKLQSTEFNVYDSSNILRSVKIEEVPASYTGISSIEVTNPGFGYTSEPTITITGDGTGATAYAKIVKGKIESIILENRGIDYSKATVSISGGGGIGATASAVIDAKYGTLRTIYYTTNAERKIVQSNIGTINYDSGLIELNDLKIESLPSNLTEIKLTVLSEEAIISSKRNNIISIDTDDSSSISILLNKQ